MPEDVGGGYFAGLRETQQAYLPMVIRDFGPVPLRTVPFFDREMVGAASLSEIGLALFGDDDPSEFFYRGRPYRVRVENGTNVLEVALPFTARDEVRLSRDGEELLLQVGGWRRTLVLPRALVDSPTRGAKMEDGILRIEFEARKRATARGGGR
jgi:arsenite-transporting ATPase